MKEPQVADRCFKLLSTFSTFSLQPLQWSCSIHQSTLPHNDVTAWSDGSVPGGREREKQEFVLIYTKCFAGASLSQLNSGISVIAQKV